MGELIAFHQSSRGYVHVMNETVCQDYSLSYQDKYCSIALVADGHGAPACCRSDIGSKLVVEIGMEQIKEFAKEMTTIWENAPDDGGFQAFMGLNHQKACIRTLTDRILAKWHEAIAQDLKENPLTEEDYAHVGDYDVLYRKGNFLPHMYGTTFIAALWLKDILLLIQQGDGQCNVFYKDGTMDQPIPRDPRCHENVTTSMCDVDASTSIRSWVIDVRNQPVIGCFLGSDGVEDSFRDVLGNFVFYKELIPNMLEKLPTIPDIQTYLAEYLPAFSQVGSGDDISVAGIFEPSAFIEQMASYRYDVERYYLQEACQDMESKLSSMEQKHGILEQRLKDCEDALKPYQHVPFDGGEREQYTLYHAWKQAEGAFTSYHEIYQDYSLKKENLLQRLNDLVLRPSKKK